MVTLNNASNALKEVYLGVVSEQLNTGVNPLLARIKQTTADVWGKEIRKMAPYGLNGGIGAGTEDGNLPAAGGNNYVQFVLGLKNLYGKIEISDKAVRASENNAGAFVNLLNAEMEGLVRASSYNFGRMLYGTSKGILAQITDGDASSNGSISLEVSDTRNLIEGMIVDVSTSAGVITSAASGSRITSINRSTKIITLAGVGTIAADALNNKYLTIQGSFNYELTGLGDIFNTSLSTLYGVTRANYAWMNPYISTLTADGNGVTTGSISDIIMQKAVDSLEEDADSKVDFIVCSSGVKRNYQEYLASYRSNVDVLDLAGGFKAISFNGIPVVSDKFCPANTMFLLNTKEFNLHQLCDWQWLEGENGRVLRQNEGKPTYSATLVKYADIICNKPMGQAKLTNITES